MNKENIKIGAFISIPKCASKTILSMFELGRNRDDDGDATENNYIIFENHQRLISLENKYKSVYNFNDLYIFTFVRNPYDRIISWYYYHNVLEPYKNYTLNDWVKNGCKVHWTVQNMTNWKEINKSPLLQYNFIEGNKNIDFIGKMENFEEDCKKLIDILNNIFINRNIDKRITYSSKIHNKTKQKKEELTDESKRIIYKMFKKDFEYFGYEE